MTLDLATMAGRAVSANDLAATLESNGLGDSYARSLGSPDIFSLADAMFAQHGQPPSTELRTRPRRHRVLDSALRAVVLVVGTILCILTLPAGMSLPTIAAAGIVSWLTAHVTAAVVWAELGTRGRADVGATAWPVALAGLILAGGTAAVTGSAAALTWGVWGVTAGILLPLYSPARLTLGLGVLAVPSLWLLWSGGAAPARVVATTGILSLAAIAVRVLWPRSGGPTTDRGWRRCGAAEIRLPLVQALVQVAAQALCFLTLLFALPPTARAGVGFGCLVAAALGDPVLTIVDEYADRWMCRPRPWRQLQAGLVVLAVGASVALALAAGAVAYAWPAPVELRLAAGEVTALVALIGLTVSVPLRAGWGARATHNVIVAAVPVTLAVAWLNSVAVGMEVLVPSLLGAVLILTVTTHVRALNSPHRW